MLFEFVIGVTFLCVAILSFIILNSSKRNIKRFKLIQKSNEYLGHLLESLPTSFIVTDEKRVITASNLPIRELTGYSKNELFGLNVESILTTDLAGEEIFHESHDKTEALLKSKSGKEIPVLISTSILKTEANKKAGIIYSIQDISLINKYQTELIRSETKYRKLIENAGDVLYICDYKGNFTYFNAALKKLTGYEKEDLLHKHFTVLIKEEWTERVTSFYLKQFESRRPETLYEFPIETKDKKTKWVEQTVVLIRRGDRVSGFQCIVRDISERKSSEEKIKMLVTEVAENKYRLLKESEETTRIQRVLHFQAALLKISSQQTKDLNQALKELTLKSAEALLVDRVSVWMFHESDEKLVCKMAYCRSKASFESGDAINRSDYPKYFQSLSENRFVAASDARTDFFTSELSEEYFIPLGILSVLDVPMRVKGKLIGVVCHEHIHTKRNWTHEEETFAASVADMASLVIESNSRLKAEKEAIKFSQVVKKSPAFICIATMSGNLIFINDFGKQMIGLPESADISPLTIKHLTNARGWEITVKDEWPQLKEYGFWKGEKRLKNQNDKSSIPVSVVSFLIQDIDGEGLAGYATIQNDISNQVKFEKKIRLMNEELERRVQARTKELEAFSYSVSHDLRTPLRAIYGYAKLLHEDLKNLSGQNVSMTNLILKNTEMMSRLIDDLLSFSRIGRMSTKPAEIDLNMLIDDVVSNFAGERTKFVIHKLPTIIADIPMLRQVFVNLIGNAVKYSRKAKNPEVIIGSNEDNSGNVIFVKDNGVGFDTRFRNELFKVFNRLHSEQDFEGTGVGLAIVKQIIEKHHGEVWAQSVPGKGATFFVRLPKSIDEKAAA